MRSVVLLSLLLGGCALLPRASGPVTIGDDTRRAAQQLDTELHRWLREHGGMRKDASAVYALDLAPLLLYAAGRGDKELYLKLHAAVQPLILTEQSGTYTAGFVLWRRARDTPPEISGATEAMWMARALMAGARAFNRPADRAQALKVLDGWARHAFELQGVWLVRKYYSFAGSTFASLSALPSYHADFLDELEKAGARGDWVGMAERSYALIERARNRAGLLNPVIQPEIGAGFPDMKLETYAPNNLASLEDSCLGAEGVARGDPAVGNAVLDFVLAGSHRRLSGKLWSYYDARSGDPVDEGPSLPETGYACLVRLAVALGRNDALAELVPAFTSEMQRVGEVPQLSEAFLYSAGPLLLAAEVVGALAP